MSFFVGEEGRTNYPGLSLSSINPWMHERCLGPPLPHEYRRSPLKVSALISLVFLTARGQQPDSLFLLQSEYVIFKLVEALPDMDAGERTSFWKG
jgi:hypothetical protein